MGGIQLDFIERWFKGFSEGIEKLNREERGRLFSSCASLCAKDALKYLYQDLFTACDGNLDIFFSRLNEVHSVDGKVIEKGKVYEIIFLNCNCELHTQANVDTAKLCECSRQSIICELKTLLPDREFLVEEKMTILNGDTYCCFRITKNE